MATNDFIYDLVEKFAEEKIEYLVIAIQKGDKEHKANAFFNITTVDGADMILTTVDQVYKSVEEDDPGSIEEIFPDDESDDDHKEGAD